MKQLTARCSSMDARSVLLAIIASTSSLTRLARLATICFQCVLTSESARTRGRTRGGHSELFRSGRAVTALLTFDVRHSSRAFRDSMKRGERGDSTTLPPLVTSTDGPDSQVEALRCGTSRGRRLAAARNGFPALRLHATARRLVDLEVPAVDVAEYFVHDRRCE